MIREADEAHLAGANQIVEGAQRFFERNLRIGLVGVVEVDVVSAQPAQARFEGGGNLLAGKAVIAWPTGPELPRVVALLGRQHDLPTASGQRSPDDFLGRPIRRAHVDLGGIDEIESPDPAPGE